MVNLGYIQISYKDKVFKEILELNNTLLAFFLLTKGSWRVERM